MHPACTAPSKAHKDCKVPVLLTSSWAVFAQEQGFAISAMRGWHIGAMLGIPYVSLIHSSTGSILFPTLPNGFIALCYWGNAQPQVTFSNIK